MPNLVRLLYVSEATVPFTQDELSTLLAKSRRNNGPRGVTGLLLYASGHFMQVLEGSAEAVTERLTVISADPRHRRVHRLLCEVTAVRLFAQWSMATLNPDGVSPLDRMQIRQLIEQPTDPTVATDRTQVHTLLRNFHQQLSSVRAAA